MNSKEEKLSEFPLRHIIITLSGDKDRERILKKNKENQLIMYKGDSIRLTADFC